MDHIIRANAGYSKPFEELSDSQVKRQMEVNFLGSINVVIMAVEAMRGWPNGRWILQNTSTGGQRG